jgi:large subunit ribosomal protein L15
MPMQRRLPKIGFRSKMSHESAEVLLYQLAMLDTDVIDVDVLRAAKLVTLDAKKIKVVKKGELTKKLTIKGLLVTAGAKAAIEAAGGSVE